MPPGRPLCPASYRTAAQQGPTRPSGTHTPIGAPRAHRGSTRPAGTLAPQHQEAWAAPALILSHWTWGVFAAVIVKTFCL